jgi:hypothetical protein
MPFHAAEPHSKKQKNVSAEHPLKGAIFRGVCFLRAAQGSRRPSDRLPFLLVRFLWGSKENERLRKLLS